MNSNQPPLTEPAAAPEPPFNPGLYGLIVIGLAFLVALGYFLLLMPAGDKIDWDVSAWVDDTGSGEVFKSSGRGYGEVVNFFLWPFLFFAAMLVERWLSRLLATDA